MFEEVFSHTPEFYLRTHATPEELGIPRSHPTLQKSDAGGSTTSSEEERVDASQEFYESERIRDMVRQRGVWPDGSCVGQGHGSPYLQPLYADQIWLGDKSVEGRPNTGVSACSPNPVPILAG